MTSNCSKQNLKGIFGRDFFRQQVLIEIRRLRRFLMISHPYTPAEHGGIPKSRVQTVILDFFSKKCWLLDLDRSRFARSDYSRKNPLQCFFLLLGKAKKNTPKKLACGGLVDRALIILKNFPPAAGFYYFYFF